MPQEEDNFDSQVLGSSLSLSLPSEPPDIRNWFSSYEYESPASDSLNDFGNTELIDELASGEKTGPNAFVECQRDDKLENPNVNERNHDSEGNKDRYGWNDLCSSKISDQGWADSTLQNHDTEPTKMSSNQGFIQRTSEANSPTKGVGPVSSDCASDRIVVNGDSRKKTSLLVRSRNTGMVLSTGEKNVGVRRKVLSEKTNLPHSDVTEIAGKWKCPQKSKPDLGPPLKQLRLEQWVHRL
ncbi:hypothetical protein CK203_076813 [Vitis vinifera]|uniref:Uncharacterized protein n=1 Tax=Vitis vinifera TaxID=29760 RepID=A0A438ET57_VITVI|nr:hypothetical protein CK203_076813 [Vitis vinifera]